MKVRIRFAQIGLALVGIFMCAVIAVLLPPLWQGVSGRDFRPQGALMAVLLVFTSTLFRGRLGWRVTNLIIALLMVEIITLTIIGYFSGYTGLRILDSFNLHWLAFMNIFIGLPWLLGLGIGSVWHAVRGRPDRGAGAIAVEQERSDPGWDVDGRGRGKTEHQ